jgi:type II secretory pathway predicted ATPase ExeA
MSETYIDYWGLKRHPFLLAPDSKMMHVTGQYFECLERLKYAINTNKGGVLVISEDAGLGKTTLLLKLVDDMREEYGKAFKCAFVEHPTLSPEQMIAQITEAFSGVAPSPDKLENLKLLREALVQVKEQGGKNIIIVDEGQMLCASPDVLQELRALINLTHNSEYLHTFILSGQKALWGTVRDMPEFWQRLPVRYYFVPLRLEEAKDLIHYRLNKAGLDDGRDIFSEDALEILHRYSKGSPRTLIALSDLSLLVGYTNRATKVGFKEVTKAISAMAGKGETLPYMRGETERKHEVSLGSIGEIHGAGTIREPVAPPMQQAAVSEQPSSIWRNADLVKPFLTGLAIFCLVLIGALGYRFIFAESKSEVKTATAAAAKPAQPQPVVTVETAPLQAKPETAKEESSPPAVKAKPARRVKVVVVSKDGANVRVAPDLKSDRIGIILRGESLRVKEEKTDKIFGRWYRVNLYGNRDGWISDKVVTLREQVEQ